MNKKQKIEKIKNKKVLSNILRKYNHGSCV